MGRFLRDEPALAAAHGGLPVLWGLSYDECGRYADFPLVSDHGSHIWRTLQTCPHNYALLGNVIALFTIWLRSARLARRLGEQQRAHTHARKNPL